MSSTKTKQACETLDAASVEYHAEYSAEVELIKLVLTFVTCSGDRAQCTVYMDESESGDLRSRLYDAERKMESHRDNKR